MISIIIPVYNTENYLRKCLDSILGQTYTDYEIITVNDGSLDRSLDILREYEKKDNRIRVIDKKNEGQGIARNVAIEQANGDVIYFIDSDDWITEDSLTVMIECMQSYDADVVIGNLATTYLDSEEIEKIHYEKMNGIIEEVDIKSNLFKISAAACPKLIKKSLFKDNDIRFPNFYFEDLAVLPIIYALSKRIAFVNQCVYIQRMHRKSTVHNIHFIYDRIRFVEYLVGELKKINKYEDYKDEIKEYLMKRSQINLRVVKELCNSIYSDYSKKQHDEWFEKYGVDTLKSRNSFCFGSYNLMIVTKIFMGLEDSAPVLEYYGGSSVISSMCVENSQINQIKLYHENSFRRKMLINDFERHILNMNPSRMADIDYFFIDFLEERYDIAEYKGEYFTLSQAFLDISNDLKIDYRVIKSFTKEWWNLWEKACDNFINKIEILSDNKKIMLVEMSLSEQFFDETGIELFSDIDNIRYINSELEKCYRYFINHCPSAVVVKINGMEEYKTNRYFRHGCYPWHLSDCAYVKIAKVIEKEICVY